jgi:hypothetical protein
MQQWEYFISNDEGNFSIKYEGLKWDSLEHYLNEKGRQGWELVQGPTHAYNQCIFKRPKK